MKKQMKKLVLSIFIMVFVVLSWKGDTIYAAGENTVKITSQPVSVTVKEGATASATVVAIGDGLTYQWYCTDNASDSTFAKSSIKEGTYATTMKAEKNGRKIYCVVTDKYGNTAKTNTVTLSMGAKLQITQQPVSVTVGEGKTAKATVVATGDGLSYQWYCTDNASDSTFAKSSIKESTYATAMKAEKNGRKIYCVITDKYGATAKTNTVTLSMGAKLQITQQPVSVTVGEGKTAKATVVATGDGLSYQWYCTDNASDSTFAKSSIKESTYATAMKEEKNGRKIYCVVTDKYGNTAKTNTVTLNMGTKLRITQQPVSVTVGEGQTAKATVVATGDGLSYQWYCTDNASDSTFSKSSIKESTYATAMKEEKNGRKIYCVVTDKYGNTVKTNTVTLSMRTKLQITQQPANLLGVKNGQTAKATVVATGDGLTYQWYYKNYNETGYKKSSITSNTYTIVMDISKTYRQVYCVITDKYGNTVTSDVAMLYMIREELKVTEQPLETTVKNGDTAIVSVKAVGDDLKYQWYCTSGGDSDVFLKSSNTTSTYRVDMTPEKHGRKIYCEVTDAWGQKEVTNSVYLYMEGGVQLERNYAGVTGGVLGVEVTQKVYATGDGLTYQWYYTENGSSDTFLKSNNKTDIYSVILTDENNGREVYCVVTDKYGCKIKSRARRLSGIYQEVRIKKEPNSVTVAAGQTATTTVVANGYEVKYQWYCTQNGSSDTFLKSSNTTDTYSIVMDASKDGRKVYCIATDKRGNTVKSATATLSIAAPIQITQQPQDILTEVEGYVYLSVTAEGEELEYEWYGKEPGEKEFKAWTSNKECRIWVYEDDKEPRYFYCKITDKYGQSITTNIVKVQYIACAKIISQPMGNSFKMGEVATTQIEAIGDGLKYQWYCTQNGSSTQFMKSSITKPVYSFIMEESKADRKVYCVVTDKYGNSVKSNTVNLSKWTPMKITTQPKDVVIDCGETMSLSVKISAGKAPYTYSWYNSKGKLLGSNEGNSLSCSFKKKIYEEDFINEMKFYCVITDAYGDTITTNRVGIAPKTLKITQQPVDVTVAIGKKPTFSVKAEGGSGKLTYYWQRLQCDEPDTVNTAYGDINTGFGDFWFYIDPNGGGLEYNRYEEYYSGYYTDTLTVDLVDNYQYGYALRCVISDENGTTVVSEPVYMRPTKLTVTQGCKVIERPDGTLRAAVMVDGGTAPYTYNWYLVKGNTVSRLPEDSYEVHSEGGRSSFTYLERYDEDKLGKPTCIIQDADGNEVTAKCMYWATSAY